MRITLLFAVILCCTMVTAAADRDSGQEVSLQLFIPASEVQQYDLYPLVVAVTNNSKEPLNFSQPMLCGEESELRAKATPKGAQLVLVYQLATDAPRGVVGSWWVPPYRAVEIAPRETGLVMNHIIPQIIRLSGNRAKILAMRDGKVIGSTDWNSISLEKK